MIAELETIYTYLESDATLQGLLGGSVNNSRIYPAQPDTIEEFPCIVWQIVDQEITTYPINGENLQIQYSIFSKENYTEVETIHERLDVLLRYYTDTTNKIRWCKLLTASQLFENDRRIFSKACRYQFWIV